MKLSSVLKIGVLLIALIFLGNQLISSLYKPVVTENAVYETTVDGLKISGVIIREEILVTNQNSGVTHFIISDGERVSKNGVIANLYENESASITVSRMESVAEKIKDIEDILSYNDVEAVNLDIINAKVETKMNNLILASATGDFHLVSDSADELLSAANRKKAALGIATDFSAQLASLNEQYNQLAASLPNKTGSIYASESGYFVSKTDGLENVLKFDDLSNVTPEFLDSVKAEASDFGAIGKIVSDYEWYIAAKISLNESYNFKEGDELTLATAIKSSPELPVTVKKINVSEKGDDAVIIFACNQMNSELASMRGAAMTVIKSEYSGLRVARKALRVVDSVRGVYVLNGMQISFVPVEVVYYGEDYVLCKKQTEDNNSLKLYDRVVVKGKNLYDGKIVS